MTAKINLTKRQENIILFLYDSRRYPLEKKKSGRLFVDDKMALNKLVADDLVIQFKKTRNSVPKEFTHKKKMDNCWYALSEPGIEVAKIIEAES